MQTILSPGMAPVCHSAQHPGATCSYIMAAMARGWESKSVEEQQAAASTQVDSKQRLTPEQAARKQAREAIELSRRRVLQQLQSVQHPRHRQMLESALSELDERLARLG